MFGVKPVNKWQMVAARFLTVGVEGRSQWAGEGVREPYGSGLGLEASA